MKLIAIYGSSREKGNSELLTEQVLKEIPAERIYLREKNILPIVDKRHEAEGFSPVDDDYHEVITRVMEHDVIIFATPLYWYGMSGIMKNFIDRWSHSLRDDRYNFKEKMQGKKAYVIIAGGEQARIKGLPLVQQFQYIFDFMSMHFAGYMIGQGNKPGDVLQDDRAMSDAQYLNQQLKSMI
ncbi:flavodoxin family protein [Thermoflavimicrobium dichotomicum]|uniref:Multimeric flavodoxin WrbA n=1 Tax=Thermoflavimicrobium dichotomicum TaxID=46223 RepID=A0A1I3P5M8_9BACL|nr:flavodoxin family protein [Thermoflavimicrobium dichotomicum]SFJ16865.1 Multimeric flavodoxin WrbA [Thermoflavimicrobium dichotomicum]